MADIESEVNALKVEISALKEKVSFFNVIYGKFDETLSKVQKLMEDRRNETNEDLREVYQKIQDTESKIMSEIKAMRAEMNTARSSEVDKINAKLENLDKWRWQMMGGATVVGFLISKIAQHFF